MRLAAGTNIGSNLRLLRALAQGGMGSVWVADHLALRTQVAVKFMAESVAGDESATLRFSREAAASAQIKSPHVVQTFDHGLLDGRIPYIVMELLEGSSLGNRLRELGSIDTRVTAAILGQVCRALTKAHTLGIVHRDIKPDNLFLIDSGGELFVKVLDFGIAKQSAEPSLAMTTTGVAVGTPSYMSPEQIVSAKEVTFTTDLWALGVVAYQCLTGRLPFLGDTYGGLCIEISRGKFPAPSTLRTDIPPALDGWFARAFELEPSNRFASARELASLFQSAAGFPPDATVSAASAALLGGGRAPVNLAPAIAPPKVRLAESTVGVDPPSAWPELASSRAHAPRSPAAHAEIPLTSARPTARSSPSDATAQSATVFRPHAPPAGATPSVETFATSDRAAEQRAETDSARNESSSDEARSATESAIPLAGPSHPSIQGASLGGRPSQDLPSRRGFLRPWMLWAGGGSAAVIATVILRGAYPPAPIVGEHDGALARTTPAAVVVPAITSEPAMTALPHPAETQPELRTNEPDAARRENEVSEHETTATRRGAAFDRAGAAPASALKVAPAPRPAAPSRPAPPKHDLLAP